MVPLSALFLETVHPGTSTLGWAPEIVAIEESSGFPVLVYDLKSLHVRMVEGNIGALLECQTISAVGGIENTIDEYAVNIEVGLYLVVADIQLLLLHLGRIVKAVVGLKLEGCSLALASEFLYGLCFGIGLRGILGDETLQKSVDVFRCLGHRFFQRIGGIVGIPHDFCLLSTELCNLANKRESIVLRIGAVSAMDGSLIDLLSQVAVVETG